MATFLRDMLSQIDALSVYGYGDGLGMKLTHSRTMREPANGSQIIRRELVKFLDGP
jgi:hypothetical protein